MQAVLYGVTREKAGKKAGRLGTHGI